jgi:hypothetical protein
MGARDHPAKADNGEWRGPNRLCPRSARATSTSRRWKSSRPRLRSSPVPPRPLGRTPYRVVLPSGHRLAGEYTIDLADLAEDPWVETACGLCCCWEVSREAFRRAGFVPRRAVEAADYWAAQSFVAAGLGMTMIPALGLGAVHDQVTVPRLGPDPEPIRRVLAVTRPAMGERIPRRPCWRRSTPPREPPPLDEPTPNATPAESDGPHRSTELRPTAPPR